MDENNKGLTEQQVKPKKERNVDIKVKHRKVAKSLAQGDSKKTALLKAGYSPKTNPAKVIETKGFQMLLKEQVKDETLINVLNEGLGANKLVDIDNNVEYPDHATRHKFMESGMRLKGYTVEDKNKGDQIINIALILDKIEENVKKERQDKT